MSSKAFIEFWESIPLGERISPGRPSQDIARMGWNGAVEHAAGLVEAAGCVCLRLVRPTRTGVPHDPRCPVALAAKIREGA